MVHAFVGQIDLAAGSQGREFFVSFQACVDLIETAFMDESEVRKKVYIYEVAISIILHICRV